MYPETPPTTEFYGRFDAYIFNEKTQAVQRVRLLNEVGVSGPAASSPAFNERHRAPRRAPQDAHLCRYRLCSTEDNYTRLKPAQYVTWEEFHSRYGMTTREALQKARSLVLKDIKKSLKDSGLAISKLKSIPAPEKE